MLPERRTLTQTLKVWEIDLRLKNARIFLENVILHLLNFALL